MTASLVDDAGRFEFFQAVRLIENGAVAGVRGKRIGKDHAPREEAVRLRGSPSLGFPADAIESLEVRRSPVAGQGRFVELVAALGALGAGGPMPWHYTEYVHDRMSQRDRSLHDFIDALQHRSLSFFYRAWRKYRLPFACEAEHGEGRTDDFSALFAALVGLAGESTRARVPEGAHRWLFFAGLFAGEKRTAAGLEAMVAAITHSRAEVREFAGRWQELLPEERSRLGGRGADEFRNGLGSSLILGSSCWDVLSGVRVRIGPIAAKHLAEFTSRAGCYRWLADLVRSYLGPSRTFELVAVVDPATVRPARLAAGAAVLGGAAWLASRADNGYQCEVTLHAGA